MTVHGVDETVRGRWPALAGHRPQVVGEQCQGRVAAKAMNDAQVSGVKVS